MLLAGVPLGGLFDSDWDVVVSFLLFFPTTRQLLGNKHICASSSIYYYISILHYLTISSRLRPFDAHFSLDQSPRPSQAPPSCPRHNPSSQPRSGLAVSLPQRPIAFEVIPIYHGTNDRSRQRIFPLCTHHT